MLSLQRVLNTISQHYLKLPVSRTATPFRSLITLVSSVYKEGL